MPGWPGGVPTSCDIATLQEVDSDMLVRWKPDFGLEKLRRRSSMVIPMISYQKTMTLAAWDALISWYRSTLLNGALTFTGNHPRTGAAISGQFSQMPQMSTTDSSTVCRVSIQYAILPTAPTPWWNAYLVGTTAPLLFADFSTESSATPLYMYNGLSYNNAAQWASALSGVVTRPTQKYVYNTSGILVPVSPGALAFDCDPVTHVVKGLLMENQSINRILDSQITGSGWTPSAGATIAAGAAVSPDGSSNASVIHFAANVSSGIFQNVTGLTNGVVYTISFWWRGHANAAGLSLDVYDPVTGHTSIAVPPLAGGYVRFNRTFTMSGTSGTFQYLNQVNPGSAFDVDIWGYQLEQKAGPTSLIPTTTSIATRNADQLNVGSASIFSLIAATILAKYWARSDVSTASGIFSLADNAVLNRMDLRAGTGATTSILSVGGSNLSTLSPGSVTAGTLGRVAIAAIAGNHSACVNGGAVSSGAPASFPAALNLLEIGGIDNNSSNDADLAVSAIGYWPVNASPAQLQALTA